jgi:hypothetical protein
VKFDGQVATAIQVPQNADGRLELFIADDQWNVWHIWQVVPNANWSAEWSSLAKPQGVNASSGFSMVAIANEVEELEVFLKDDDSGQIFSRSQTVRNGNWEPTWTNLGTPPAGVFFPPVRDFVVAGPNSTLTIQVIALGSDGNLYHATRSRFVVGGGAWSAWSQISPGPAGVELDWLPVVRENQDRRLELFAFAAPNLWHTWQSNPELWSGVWDNLGAPPGGSDDTFDAHLDQGGMLNVVAWGNNPVEIFQLHQTAPNNGWTGWGILREGANPNEFGSPTLILVPSSNGLLNLFSKGLGDQIYYIPQIVLKA